MLSRFAATLSTPDRDGPLVGKHGATDRAPFLARIPLHGYLGLALNLAAWISSWGRIGPWSYTFFPLWFGFILFLDGLSVARGGTSLLTRSRWRFASLFLISIPFWWGFEALNTPVQNWHYLLDRTYSPLAYNVEASINFSTVLPAVMEMAELLASFTWLRPRLGVTARGTRLSPRAAGILMAIGVVMLVLPFLLPRYTYWLIWCCMIFIVDPINNLAGRRSAFGRLLARDWSWVGALALGALGCGFFWEMWNFYALPKWYYTVPIVGGFPHLFEMPLPGYLGYLGFGVELFVMYQFVLLLTRQREDGLAL